MEKVVNVNFNQGMDSMVRVLNYLRRKEIDVKSVNMEKVNGNDITVSISFHESVSEDKILSHFRKLYDVKDIQMM
ncbi:ACT domain-containing protein [Clostridium cylindrosporum]|uniref:ACT domain-containing protein n=1 Tax=Clostridium cylindrosporum DSM 605 TaxID=1121307 RepID=A0A0J8DA32_CLOCY|nr:ACT domain-containing protein [Clostridium cylindrosporum]KMT22707.1 hypothetical protein CLCY_11c00410 [Clostridium cylindrosporum DSM 605]